MGFTDRLTKTITASGSGKGFTSRLNQPKLGADFDLNSVEGLQQAAVSSGYGKEAQAITAQPKLSALQRLGKGLSAFNPAQAISTGAERGLGAGLIEYPKNIISGIGSAITGTDYETDRKYFKDIAEDLGVENGIAKFGIGFVGDILLDPSTYFGGAIAKGLTKVVGKTGSLALQGIGKVAPATEEGLKMAGMGLKDALGRAFDYGYKATKGAKEDVLTFLSKEQKAQLGLASSNLNRLGTGVLNKSQQEELALKMVAGKRAEFMAREAGQNFDEAGKIAQQTALQGTTTKVAGLIEQQSTRAKKFAEEITENPYEIYFPFLKNDKVEKFIKETYGIKIGSEGYRKQFKNLLTNENIELNPAKAFFTRESQIVSDNMTRGFLQGFVKKYGKPLDEFSNIDSARKAGFDILREKGVFGKEIGYVSKYDAALIKDSISPEFQTINMLAKATGFDTVTSLFKRAVTGLFAPFHIRNYVSGVIQNYEVVGKDALNPQYLAVGQKLALLMDKGKKMPSEIIELGGKKVKFSAVMKPFVDRFSGDTFYNADFDFALKNGEQLKQVAGVLSKGRIKETIKTAGLGQEGIPFKVARAVGQYIEHQQKAVAYVASLGQGKNIDEALRIAEAAGFDYRALTRFESQIMRRLIPFYSFTRKNIELQMKTLGENPQRINQVLRFFGNLGEPISEKEKQQLPGYLKEAIGIKLPDTAEGLKQYISSFGTPIEQFSQLFGSDKILRLISQTNPILKVPMEIGIGKDSFRKTDLKDTYDAREYKLAPQIIKDLLEIKEVRKDILTKNSAGKLVKTGERIQYVADPNKLLIARGLFTTRGVSYLDQIFGGDMQGFIKFIKLFTGVKPQQLDLNIQQALNDKKTKRALEDMLIKFNVIKRFETPYVPK